MGEVIPLAFEDNLIRSVVRQDEPWFVGRDVCHVLGLVKPDRALDRLDDDEKGPHSVSTPGGPQTVTIISEAGCYRLVFTSRKPEAERFKRWLAHEVLPALRKHGKYETPGRDTIQLPPDLEGTPLAAASLKLALAREARLIFGARRAQELWRDLGLPAVPYPRPEGEEEARHCLNHLLHADSDRSPRGVMGLIEDALNDATEAALALIQHGIRAEPAHDGEGGFVVANRSFWLARHYADTPFKDGRYVHVLRRLPGTRPVGPQRFDAGVTSRGTFVPARYLDLWGHGRTEH